MERRGLLLEIASAAAVDQAAAQQQNTFTLGNAQLGHLPPGFGTAPLSARASRATTPIIRQLKQVHEQFDSMLGLFAERRSCTDLLWPTALVG